MMRHSHPPHLPPAYVMRREHTWPSAERDQDRRRRWTPPDPGSLLAQVAAHTAEPLWKRPQNWTQAHVDFFCCRFENADALPPVPAGGGADVEASEDGDTLGQMGQVVSSARRQPRRASSITSLLSNREGSSSTPTRLIARTDPLDAATVSEETPPPRWTAAKPFRFALGWSRPAAPRYRLLRAADNSQRGRIKKMLDRGTGLDFYCKRQELWLLVDGVQCAPLELNLCVPSEQRQRPPPPTTTRRWRSSDGLGPSFLQRRSTSSSSSSSSSRKGKRARKSDSTTTTTTSGATTSTTTPTAPPTPPQTPPPPPPQPPPPPPPPRIFPAAALVGEHSQAATLLRGLALGHVELGGVDQVRAEQYPYQRFEARANAPVAATLHKCLRDVTPVVRLHDPYLLAVIIAMAQAQEVWRARLRAEDEEVLRRNGEEWLCKGGYKVHLIVTDHRDPSGVFVYGATIPPSLLAMLRYPRRAPSTASSSCPDCESSTESSPQRSSFTKDEVIIKYQKVPYQPVEDFEERVVKIIEAGCGPETTMA